MKTFKILFYLIVLLSLSCNKKSNKSSSIQKDCVEDILKQDDSLGTIRNHACKTTTLSKTISQYTSSINDLDFSSCPEEFSQAFEKHIKAWNDMILITTNHDSLRGEMHDLFDKIKVSKDSLKFKTKLKAIWDTWEEIEKNLKLLS